MPVRSTSSSARANGAMTEESLIEDVMQLIRRFIERPNRMHSYEGTIEWRIFSDNTVSIQVSIYPAHPS